MNPFDSLFKAENPTDNFWESFVWWEIRRIPYNLIVGLTGLASTAAFIYAGSLVVQPGEDFVEPLGLLFGIFAFGIGANVCYTLGWVLESQLDDIDQAARRTFREKNYKLGLLGSVGLAAVPSGLAFLIWLGSKLP